MFWNHCITQGLYGKCMEMWVFQSRFSYFVFGGHTCSAMLKLALAVQSKNALLWVDRLLQATLCKNWPVK